MRCVLEEQRSADRVLIPGWRRGLKEDDGAFDQIDAKSES